ncbi:glycosyltransferase family 1 protein [Thiomicrorhabdus sediminis]|uniref:Glycosyltransferase family 1 protein n=1 Tax=Thiomicrorhabdus sediminis TaxID=2580412 RepID=A0A4P9K3U1_9GAMM|nr:glycosyltransferase family 1 protein [Thiomicrorhabdus sediminis]QCU89545.1 glycosyltransferase family 1 protein [Thiomicrorhabdus sediminis]
MKKVLYLMHIPWDWAKQRPHFIAENLNKYCSVDVYSLKGFNSKLLSKEKKPNFVKTLYRLPFIKSSISQKFNPYVVGFQLRKVLKNYQYVWITDPLLYSYIEQILPETSFLIYDCMDDHLSFPDCLSNVRKKEFTYLYEQKVVDRANKIFVSSGYLKNVLIERYGHHDYHVLNNGVKSGFNNEVEIDIYDKYSINRNAKVVTYVGTISEWFDFDLILNSLKCDSTICYLLVGPSDVDIPSHPNILHVGPVSHNKVFPIMSASDALIMPFKLNQLIRSVDPVKVYEYIKVNKPTVVIDYDEVKKFDKFIYLYSCKEKFFDYMSSLVNGGLGPKASQEESVEYISNSTWEVRAKEINLVLDNKI